VNKGKKMRDLCFSTVNNYQDVLQVVKKSKFWSRAAQKDAEEKLEELKHTAEDLKKFLVKGPKDIESIKRKLLPAGLLVRTCQNNIKEYKQLAARAGSVASSKK